MNIIMKESYCISRAKDSLLLLLYLSSRQLLKTYTEERGILVSHVQMARRIMFIRAYMRNILLDTHIRSKEIDSYCVGGFDVELYFNYARNIAIVVSSAH